MPNNMVDERFELLALIFRLSGSPWWGKTDTEYQRETASAFAEFAEHPAAKYAAKLPFGDAVFKYAVHTEKRGDAFYLIDDPGSLFDGRWTETTAREFLPLMNDFYADTDFAAFYQAHIPFYEEETRLLKEKVYDAIDFEWFRKYGIGPENLRCICSPSTGGDEYGATVSGKIVYCCVSHVSGAVVHEFCHGFTNRIAEKEYAENAEFRKWCDEDPLPDYGDGLTMACEYYTRAYEVLYIAEHGNPAHTRFYLLREKPKGFPYIEDVYATIAPYTKLSGDFIAGILGCGYTVGEEKTADLRGKTIRWRVLELDAPLQLENFPLNTYGNMFGTATGDVILIDGGEWGLYIDLGEGTFEGSPVRQYCNVPAEYIELDEN